MQTNMVLGIESFVKSNYPEIGRKGCAEKLGVSEKEVESVKRKFGLKLSPKGLRRVRLEYAAKQNHECNVNPEIFMNVRTPEAAYILGFIWADGNISDGGLTPCISMCQVTSDMEEIKIVLNKLGKWNYCFNKKSTKNSQQSSKAYTSNRTLYNYLYEKGYKSKSKGSADLIIETIPDSLKHLFFLGLFDGDGCLFVKSVKPYGFSFSIASSYEQDWSFMEKLCQLLRVEYRIHRNISKTKRKDGVTNCSNSYFIVSQYSNIAALMKYLYKTRRADGLGLKRKWEKWMTLCSIPVASSTRYMGIRKRERDRFWTAEIPNRYGLGKIIDLGRFDSEEEAYLFQQSKIIEMGLVCEREKISGPKEFRPMQLPELEPCS